MSDSNGFPILLQKRILSGGQSQVWMNKYDSFGKLLQERRVRIDGVDADFSLIAKGLAIPNDDRLYIHTRLNDTNEEVRSPVEIGNYST